LNSLRSLATFEQDSSIIHNEYLNNDLLIYIIQNIIVSTIFEGPQSKGFIDMAIAIRSTPVLKGTVAEKFVTEAEANLKNKGSVDFSKQLQSVKKILKKAQI